MIQVCEVGPRDGLQNERKIFSTEEKIQMLEHLVNSNVRYIEAVSFVNRKLIQQMADAEEVLQRAPRWSDVKYAGLVLSRSGMERAIHTNLDVIHVSFATTDSFNLKNIQKTVQQSLDEMVQIIAEASAIGKPVVAIISTAFGCPFEGKVNESQVLNIAERLLKANCSEIVLADTVGMANPEQVISLVNRFYEKFGKESKLGLHFHNTRGLGLANVYAGYLAGVRRFDSSIGGLGGCPFAPKAVGNTCTEDMVNMFHAMGADTGINLPKLVQTAQWTEEKIGRKLDGMMIKVS